MTVFPKKGSLSLDLKDEQEFIRGPDRGGFQAEVTCIEEWDSLTCSRASSVSVSLEF